MKIKTIIFVIRSISELKQTKDVLFVEFDQHKILVYESREHF